MDTRLIPVASEVIEHIISLYGTEFVVHVEHGAHQGDELKLLHFLFGVVDWSLYDRTRWHPQHTFFGGAHVGDIEKVMRAAAPSDWTQVTALSNDLIYDFSFDVDNDMPVVRMNLSSAVFGKGTFFSYLKLVLKGHNWIMFSPYPRGAPYARFRGTLRQCLEKFHQTEPNLEHPYQEQIKQFYGWYIRAIAEQRRFL